MKCNNCNMEWSGPASLTGKIVACPFCGKSLDRMQKKELNTVEDVLLEITTQFGVDTLKNGQKTIALFSDLCPDLKRERLLLSYLIQSDGNNKLLAVRNKPFGEQQSCFRQVCQYMTEEMFVSPEAAKRICMSFSCVIGLSLQTGKNGNPEKKVAQDADPAVLQKQKMSEKGFAYSKTANYPNPPEQRPQIDTFAKYKKALEDYYVQSGKKALSERQIDSFIRVNALDRHWGITVADVEKDLVDVYALYDPKSAPPKHVTRINTFAQYQRALEDYFLSLGRSPLTVSQIRYFINANALDHVWGITIFDVQKDLETIYAKYLNTVPHISSQKETPPPASVCTKIYTYEKYLEELEKAYLKNGNAMLTREQIISFLETHGLRKLFGVCVSEVEEDLREIAKKYS